jgi:D-alanyl-lipoteichoic acid acyltransferase DltB (MBOAT superfamily)
MTFNSIIFLGAFLPATLAGYYILSLSAFHRFRLSFLILMSLLFYGRAQSKYLPLLLLSGLANYFIAGRIIKNSENPAAKRRWLLLGVTANAGALLGLKFLSPVLGSLTAAVGLPNPLGNIIAPLAISFYTFQQISFLVEVSRGRTAPGGIVPYITFVTFFPTLLAGPISLHREVAPQLEERPRGNQIGENVLIGLLIFSLGLFKKTVLADTLALWTDPVFNAANQGHAPGFLLAWGAAFTYTFQIYFDFSGYSDMAIGVARMFGVLLPLNFVSPLRSTSISELWRRWHMTLGRFVRAYVYEPLAMPLARYAASSGYGRWGIIAISTLVPTFLAMLIIGSWHGPKWTYVIFGCMQGAFMCINEIYSVATRKKRRGKKDSRLTAGLYGILTLVAFVSAEVPFRSQTVADTFRIFSGMVGLHGLGLTPDWRTNLTLSSNALMVPLIVVGLLIVYLCPDTPQIMDRVQPALEWEKWRLVDPPLLGIRFRFTSVWIVAIGVALFLGFTFISRASTSFIYFQF